jgi:hypothetical protein
MTNHKRTLYLDDIWAGRDSSLVAAVNLAALGFWKVLSASTAFRKARYAVPCPRPVLRVTCGQLCPGEAEAEYLDGVN